MLIFRLKETYVVIVRRYEYVALVFIKADAVALSATAGLKPMTRSPRQS
jgi:hypothetical protein